jgi:hypothetical protein
MGVDGINALVLFLEKKKLSFAVREPLPAGDAKRLLHLPHGAIMSD